MRPTRICEYDLGRGQDANREGKSHASWRAPAGARRVPDRLVARCGEWRRERGEA